jgi:hypothetical protein
MPMTKIGQGQYVIDSSGVYQMEFDETNASANVPFLEFVQPPGMPPLANITVIMTGRVEGGPAAKDNIGVVGARVAGLTLIGQGFSMRGFKTAIQLVDCNEARIEGIEIRDGWLSGIVLQGNNVILRNNIVLNLGGWSEPGPNKPRSFGIDVDGQRPTLMGNVVRNVRNSNGNEAVAISIRDNAPHAILTSNIMANEVIPARLTNGGIASIGLWVGGSPNPQTNVQMTHNLISTFEVGIAASSPTAGVIAGNAITGCIEPIRNNGAAVIRGLDGLEVYKPTQAA